MEYCATLHLPRESLSWIAGGKSAAGGRHPRIPHRNCPFDPERRRITPEGIDDPFRIGVCDIAPVRWRRPPAADLPPATPDQAFSLGSIHPPRSGQSAISERTGDSAKTDCNPEDTLDRKPKFRWVLCAPSFALGEGWGTETTCHTLIVRMSVPHPCCARMGHTAHHAATPCVRAG